MENDLISREALLDTLAREWPTITDVDDYYYFVKDAPAVNAVEVVHGRWEWRNTNEYTQILTCSVCSRTEGDDEHHKYCPNCGAKMDGGGERKENEVQRI